ncbi:MAG: TRAP transporter substrate-binding protein [Phaeodactylibacter sp.]|nr:TRAP transporter substrate-binding protein [Phaeodactylibacter sp.]
MMTILRLLATAMAIAITLALSACGQPSPGASAPAAGETAAPTVHRWKLITTWPKNLPALGTAPERMADRIREMSAGRLDIKVYGAGELVGAFEVFDAVSQGTAEMGNGASYYWRSKLPIAAVFSSVPFGLTAQEMNGWLHYGGGMELWRELYEPFGIVPMAAGNTGVQMGGWFNREINSIGDLKGLKMRIPGLGGKVLEKAGGAPVLLAGGEIYTGLERGVIDATEWLGPYHDTLMGFQDIARYYYTPGWHETGTMLEFFANKEVYDKLPADLQAILKSAAAWSNLWTLSQMEAKNAGALTTLLEKGVAIRKFPREVLDKLRQYTIEVIDDMAAGDPFSRKVYASYDAFRRKAANYSLITEKEFYEKIQTGGELDLG